MSKLLLWVLIGIAAMLAMRLINLKAAQRRDQPPGRARPTPRGAGKTPAESMVQCAHCGIHLPRSEAILQNGQTWCCADHARLDHKA